MCQQFDRTDSESLKASGHGWLGPGLGETELRIAHVLRQIPTPSRATIADVRPCFSDLGTPQARNARLGSVQERSSELLALKQEVVRRLRSRRGAAEYHRQQGTAATGRETHAYLWSHSSCRPSRPLVEVASHQNAPLCLDSPTLGMSSREHAVNDLQVDRSVESKHAAAADRCVPSGPTGCSSERRRLQPGEVQEAPFADLSVHRGPRRDADGRV